MDKSVTKSRGLSGRVLAVLVALGCGPGDARPELEGPALGAGQAAVSVATGSLATARSSPIGVALTNGKVLVAGGATVVSGLTPTASSELYDPATGLWTATGSMTVARQDHCAVRLQDGRVLVVGGYASSGVLASAEIYNPATGTWSATGSMANARRLFALAVLQNGKVLALGGPNYLASVEVYDPATGTWSATGSLIEGRDQLSATVLASGKVLVVGGRTAPYGLSTTHAELYDPAAGTWSAAGFDRVSRYMHSAVLLPSGKVLVVGGFGSSNEAALYDPAAGTWSTGGNISYSRTRPTLAVLSDGSVAAVGGNDLTTVIERYVPASNGWSAVDNLVGRRSTQVGALLANGSLLVAAGNDYTTALRSAELFTYNASSDTTPPETSITAPANGATVSGVVTITANASDNVGVTKVELYVGATLLASDLTAPYSTTWDTRSYYNGSYTLTSKAYDAAGNATTSAGVVVQTSNDQTAPTTSITAPANGATVSGSITVTADAADNVGVSQVTFYLDGVSLGTDTAAPYSISWNTMTASNGSHSLTSRARDTSGNEGTSSPVTVTVSNAGSSLAVYDATLRAPKCGAAGSACDTGTLVNGRASLGPEPNASNTINASCADGTGGTYHSDESIDQVKVMTTDGTAFAPGKTVRVEVKVWAWSSGTSDQLDLYYAANAASPAWVYLTTITPPAGGAQTLSATYSLPSGTLQAVRAAFRYGGSASPCATGSYNDRDDLAFAVGP